MLSSVQRQRKVELTERIYLALIASPQAPLSFTDNKLVLETKTPVPGASHNVFKSVPLIDYARREAELFVHLMESGFENPDK